MLNITAIADFYFMEIRNIAIIAHVDHPSTTSSLCSDGYGARVIAIEI